MQSVEEMWQACQHNPLGQVARANGRSSQALASEFRRAGFVGGGPKDPSPQQIREACLQIRAEWDAETERSRWMGFRRDEFGLL